MEKRNDTLRLSDAEVRLFLGARRIADGHAGIVCDRMVILVQQFTGNEDDVVIYKRDGKRRVGQLRMLVELGSGPSNAPVATDFDEAVDDITPDEQKRLLAIYDKFSTRTWVQ